MKIIRGHFIYNCIY